MNGAEAFGISDDPGIRPVERVRDAFGIVFLLVLLTYVLTSLLSNRGWDAVVLVAASSFTSLVALAAAGVRPRVLRPTAALAVVMVVLAGVAAAADDHAFLEIASVIQVALLGFATLAVLARVLGMAQVNSSTILGAISVYTVLGLLFTFLYGVVDRVQNAQFFDGHNAPTGSDFIFFSYTTLTTTGYGNLVPAGQPGRMISGLEMMIGQVFLVTLVAGLVALWRPGERLRRRRGEEVRAQAPDG